MGRLEGKSVIVTGGGKDKSVGYGIARAYARENANVAIVGASKRKLNQARELEELYGTRVICLHMPHVDASAIEAAVLQVEHEFGRIDVLVNCLQAARTELLANLKEPELRDTLDLGLVAPFLWMRACYPHLKKAHGTVINLMSSAAASGRPALGSLAAACEGLRALSRVAVAEWAPDGINVETMSAVAQTTELDIWAREFPEEFEQLAPDLLAGGLSSVDDVGRSCIDLCV
jgi:NAD(P)-dependent dehydrogenase (short-subunit alcohol dehydrogenase family)